MPGASQGFPPIAAPDARVLILGSLPGRVSLQQRQYYAQPHNAFWRIMGALFGAGLELPYEERTKRLVDAQVALWDVCRAAVRPGSLDAAIDLSTVVPNDFATVLRRASSHSTRLPEWGYRGAAVHETRAAGFAVPARQLPMERLPSTSPAHAALRFAQKLERWQLVLAPASR